MALVSLLCKQNQIIKRSALGTTSIFASNVHNSIKDSSNNIRNNDLFQTFGQSLSYRSFSTRENLVVNGESDFVVQPPNLKIHQKAISSPFYKMKRKEEPQVVEDAVAITDSGNENDDDKVLATTEPTEPEVETEEENAIIYDTSTQPDRKIYAIPLPERLKVPILEFESQTEVGTIHLSSHVFGQDPIREDILHRVVIYQRNKKRGKRKAKAKDRSEVRGSTRKIRQQKGTGRARAGSIRAPQRRGGGVVHGPKGGIQDYTTKLNKKVRNLGLRMAFSQKLKEGNLILFNSLELSSFKTKFFDATLQNYDIGGRFGTNAFILDWVPKTEDEEQPSSAAGVNANLLVASQNVKKVKVVHALTANVYDILKHEKLIISLSALEAIEERFST